MKNAADMDALVAEMMAGYATLPASDKVLAVRELAARKLPRRLHKHIARTITRGAK